MARFKYEFTHIESHAGGRRYEAAILIHIKDSIVQKPASRKLVKKAQKILKAYFAITYGVSHTVTLHLDRKENQPYYWYYMSLSGPEALRHRQFMIHFNRTRVL